jgi:hypothetical protein
MFLIGKQTHQDYPAELYKEWALFQGQNHINKRYFNLNIEKGSISMTHTVIYTFPIICNIVSLITNKSGVICMLIAGIKGYVGLCNRKYVRI